MNWPDFIAGALVGGWVTGATMVFYEAVRMIRDIIEIGKARPVVHEEASR